MALPANSFKSAMIHVNDTWSSGYAVPSGKKSLLLEVDVANTANPAAAIQIYVGVAQGNAGVHTANYLLVNGAPIPAGSTLPIILGQKIVLEEAGLFTHLVFKTSITGQTADVFISVMEDVQ